MGEKLLSTRILAAWVIITFAGISELVALGEWITALAEYGLVEGTARSYMPTTLLTMLPIVAVLITGAVKPESPGARPVAMFAFVEYGILLVWSAIALAVRMVRTPPADPESVDFLIPRPELSEVVALTGFAALAALGAWVSWQIYLALDTLTNEINELAEQIADLGYETEPESEQRDEVR
jgi:hypothetical protein